MRRSLGLAVCCALLSACGPGLDPPRRGPAGLVQIELSAPETNDGITTWIEQRTYSDSDVRVHAILCHPEGRPPCVRFPIGDTEGESLRQWVDATRGLRERLRPAPR